MNETPTIRPMTLGEILDKAIRLYRQNFLKFIGIFAIPYIPMVILSMLMTLGSVFITQPAFLESNNPDTMLGFGLATIAVAFISVIMNVIFVSGFGTAALTRAIANNYIEKPIGILDSYRAIKGSVWKLIGSLLLGMLLVFFLVLWSAIPLVGWFSGPGIVVFLSFIVIPFLAPIAVLENLSVSKTLRRAWDLGRSRFWWLMGYAIILALLGQLIITGPTYLITGILTAIFSSLSQISFEIQTALTSILPNLFSLILGLLYTPLQITMMTVVYFDLRARNEGLDLVLQLSPTNSDETQSENVLPEISNQSTTSILTGIDIGRFALLSLIGVMLIGCYFFFVFSFLGLASSF